MPSGHKPNSFPARLSGMQTLKAVTCSGTPVAAKRRKKNKTAAVAVAAMCSTHATSAVRPGGAEKTVKKKRKKKKKTEMMMMKSAMSGTGSVCAAASRSAIEPVAVAAVAAKVAAVVDPNPVDMIFAAGVKTQRDAKERKLEEQEAQEALVKEAESMARRPSHSRVVDPIFFEEYDPAEKIDPQRAQVHRVRRRAKRGKSPSRGRAQAGYTLPFEASRWTRRVSRRALGPQ